MKTRLLSGGTWVCGETIVPEGLTGLQLSFNFTVRGGICGENEWLHHPAGWLVRREPPLGGGDQTTVGAGQA